MSKRCIQEATLPDTIGTYACSLVGCELRLTTSPSGGTFVRSSSGACAVSLSLSAERHL